MLNQDLVNAVAAITNNVEVGAGFRGDGLDRWVKVRDLVNIDVARLNGLGSLIPSPSTAPPNSTPPSILTGLVVSGGFASMFLQSDPATDALHSFTEVWRSSTNDLGVAVKVGTYTGVLYADTIGTGGARYYWIRSISINGVPGPFNTAPNAGTLGRTSYDHSYVVRALTISWKQGNYAANSYVIPSPASETGLWYKTTLGGTTAATEPTAWPTVVGGTVVDGGITWEAVNAATVNAPFLIGDVAGVPAVVMSTVFIADASITSAKIQSLVADKIAAGTIAVAVELTAAIVTGGMVRTSSGTGWRTEISGTSGDFPLWYGTGTKSEANGRFYLKTGGGVAIRDYDGAVIFETFPGSAMTKIKNAAIESVEAGKITTGSLISDITLTGFLGIATTGALYSGQGAFDSGIGYRFEANGTSPRFSVGDSAGNKLTWETLTGLLNIVGDINTGSTIRGSHIMGTAFMTVGSQLVTAAPSGTATLVLKDTSSFPASGSGEIIDSANDRDAFSWTSKSAGTLNGCTGVLAHDSGAIVIPKAKAAILDSRVNEMRFFGDRGDGTIEELISLGLKSSGSDFIIGDFGSLAVGSNRTALRAQSNSGTGLFAESATSRAIYAINNALSANTVEITNSYNGTNVPVLLASGTTVGGVATARFLNTLGDGVYGSTAGTNSYGVRGYASGAGYGGIFECGTTGVSPLRILPSTASAAPTHAALRGSTWFTSLGDFYVNQTSSSTWSKVLTAADPVITFGSQAMAASDIWVPARGDYNFLVVIAAGAASAATISLELYDSGAAVWRSTVVARGENDATGEIENSQWGGRLYCDGTNMRFVKNSLSTTTTIYYQKLD